VREGANLEQEAPRRARQSTWSRLVRLLGFSGPALLVALGFALAWTFVRDGESPLRDINPRIQPAEFLYLDNARVVAFLSQLEDGLSEAEHQTISQTSEISVGLTGGVAGGASDEATDSVERVVTPTGASRFNRLRNRLQDHGWLKSVDARQLPVLAKRDRFYRDLRRAHEGGFVEIAHVHLTVPPAVTVYRFARRSGSPAALRFTRLVGLNPRIPVSLRSEHSPALLFVGRYASLADESSLFFGEVTVLGKVVRLVPSGALYRDNEALATYGPALASAPVEILRKLGIRRSSLARNLLEDVTVSAPGAVIIPIAVYK
jgi:hypothetical protein